MRQVRRGDVAPPAGAGPEEKVEDTIDETPASGFRLHADTVDDLRRRRAETGGRATTALWAAAGLALLVAVIALIV